MEETARNLEHRLLVVGKAMLALDSLGSFDLAWWVALLFVPEAGEGRLLLPLDLNVNVGGSEWLRNINEDFALHGVARLVEGELSLHLDATLGEVASRIREVEHNLIITNNHR